MIFNSIEFSIFLPVVFFLYWFVFQKNLQLQNTLLLGASYLFYGWWDWRFLSLIVFSTLVDFAIGRALRKEQRPSKRNMLLWTSIMVNLGFLGFFKYYNFFLENFVAAFTFFGNPINPRSLDIILPVGISFYTFQTLSYTIDVYKRKLEPEQDLIAFATFVSFFPQLVAGPIERATNLLPQFPKRRFFSSAMASDGMRQILWGLFKKVVIADTCAYYANMAFNDSDVMPGSMLLVGAVCFTFQIYGDFSGYSDIAIGTARLFGFDLKKNFAYPYFSRDIAEFWRRWHISLSTWFRDYLYIPLGGSRGGQWMKIRNTFIIFLVSGFWHGANWTFVVWGGLNALYFLPLLLANKNRNNIGTVAEGKVLPSAKELFQMLNTFWLAVLAWIFFRAESVSHAVEVIQGIFTSSIVHTLPLSTADWFRLAQLGLLLVFFLWIEWNGRADEHPLEKWVPQWKFPTVRWSFYFVVWTVIFVFSTGEQEFIYFQF